MKNVFTLLILLFCFASYSQTVSTFYQNASIDDGLAFDSEGNLYGSHYTGSIVWKITPDSVRSIFMSGLDTPNGLAFDSNGDLHIVDNQGGAIHRVSPDSTVDTYVPSIYSPSGIIKMPDSDTMIVSSWEGDRLIKVAPDGSYNDFVVGNGLEGPVGLSYNEAGDLFVGNYNDRWIFKISPSGEVDTLTRLNVAGTNIGFIVYRQGFIYATMVWDNKIYKVDMEGNYEVYAGASLGTVNGDLSEARFSNPNGIILSPGGDSLYISDFQSRSIRIIANVDGTTSTGDNSYFHSNISKSILAPNPSVSESVLNLTLSAPQVLNISITDSNGSLLKNLIARQPAIAGSHRFMIPTDSLTNGLYFVKIETDAGDQLMKKLVKIE